MVDRSAHRNDLNGRTLFYEGELKVSACPIGACPIWGTFFDELCLLMLRDKMLFRVALKENPPSESAG